MPLCPCSFREIWLLLLGAAQVTAGEFSFLLRDPLPGSSAGKMPSAGAGPRGRRLDEMTSRQPCHLPDSRLRAAWPWPWLSSDPVLPPDLTALPLPTLSQPPSSPEARQEDPCSLPFKQRESPEPSPAVHTVPLLVFPESNPPFVNSAISPSARSVSFDSHCICSCHSPEGRVGAVPAPSLRLPHLTLLPSARTPCSPGPLGTPPGPLSMSPAPSTPPCGLVRQPQ